MGRLPLLLALVAAIMLVMATVPARASGAHADCPPDCPMMQGSTAAAEHHGQAHDRGGKAVNHCEQGLFCQISPVAVASPAQPTSPAVQWGVSAGLKPHEQLPAVSHLPDRSLRPPIQL